MAHHTLFCFLLICLSYARGSVDETRRPGAFGSDVVEAALDVIQEACIFDDDKLFFRRLANVESTDGLLAKTYRTGYHGGIWQVDEAMFNLISGTKASSTSRTKILTDLGINWASVSWQDLRKPLYSALAARLYVEKRAGSTDIPRSIADQANFYRSYYRSSGDANAFKEKSTALEKGCSGISGVDLIFVLDASGSIGSTNFRKILDFTQSVVESFEISSDKTRVGVIKYASSVYEEFVLNRYNNINSLKSAINSIRYTGGGTYTNLAIDKLVQWFTGTTYGSRPASNGVPKVAIVLTDGVSANAVNTIEAAKKAHDKDIIVFAIGVGTNLRMSELYAIATDPDCKHMFLLKDFSEIASLKAAIEKKTCEAPVIIPPDGTIDPKIPPGGTQFCKLKIPPEGLTVKIYSKDADVIRFYTSRENFPTGAKFQNVVFTSNYSWASIFIPYSSNQTFDQVFCSLVNDNNNTSEVIVDTKPGDLDWCGKKPCKNGGKCEDGGPSANPAYRCDCVTGYSGQNCTIENNPCSPNPCLNSGVCKKNSPVAYTCQCPAWYSGDRCQNRIEPCSNHGCVNGKCTAATPTTYNCQCNAGYTGDKCDKEINPCDQTPCGKNGNCVKKTYDQFECKCNEGFTGQLCDKEINPCEKAPCGSNGKCIRVTYKRFECKCNEGYTGQLCESEIHPCFECMRKTNFECQCKAGYTGKFCENEINPCDPSPCVNGACVRKTYDQYECKCNKGYEGDRCQTATRTGYDCGANNPCINGRVKADKFHYPHTDPGKFVQCSEWGQCYIMNCPSGLVWDDPIQTCNRP